MAFSGSMFGGDSSNKTMSPHELYKKGVELYRSYGATSEVADLMQRAGAAGNGQALAFLGFQYQEGAGVNRDVDKAIECYRNSASLKCGMGLYNLGAAYDNGVGVSRNKELAFECFQKAADLGHEEGLNSVCPLNH